MSFLSGRGNERAVILSEAAENHARGLYSDLTKQAEERAKKAIEECPECTNAFRGLNRIRAEANRNLMTLRAEISDLEYRIQRLRDRVEAVENGPAAQRVDKELAKDKRDLRSLEQDLDDAKHQYEINATTLTDCERERASIWALLICGHVPDDDYLCVRLAPGKRHPITLTGVSLRIAMQVPPGVQVAVPSCLRAPAERQIDLKILEEV
jgi:polyhydroxyalkanoate synthesis regulator phasin